MKNAQKILSDKGLKATTQRMVILKKISDMHNHPCAEDIYNSLKEDYPSISLSTVYNTLELFVEKGIISTVKRDKGIVRYDSMNHHHHHLYCSDSERIEDYQNEKLDEILQKFFEDNKIIGFDIKEINIEIKGNFKN